MGRREEASPDTLPRIVGARPIETEIKEARQRSAQRFTYARRDMPRKAPFYLKSSSIRLRVR